MYTSVYRICQNYRKNKSKQHYKQYYVCSESTLLHGRPRNAYLYHYDLGM